MECPLIPGCHECCSATERLHYYRGNGSDELPRYEHFVESERILARVKNGSLSIKVRCPPVCLHTAPHCQGLCRSGSTPDAVVDADAVAMLACRVQAAGRRCHGG